MKKLFAFFTAVVMLICSLAVFAGAAEKIDFSNGGVIALGDSQSEQESFAAQTLRKYLEQITGAVFSIKNTAENALVTFYRDSALSEGAYTVQAENGTLKIRYGGNRGALYAAYGFLGNAANCRWYTAELQIIPENAALAVPADFLLEYTPAFEYTDTDWSSPRDPEYSAANGLSGGVYRDMPAEMGGDVSYIGQFCHTLSTVYCAESKYYEQHPEYFSNNGEAGRTQLCLTNEDVYKIVESEVLDVLGREHDADAALQILSLTQADNENYCRCDNCAASDAKYGGPSGTQLVFINRIAKAVKAAGYDNVAIDTFAYRYTRNAPIDVVPESNVIIRLCSIECCFSHTLDDDSCEENRLFMKDLSAWSEICGRIYIWDYTTNYANTACVFPDFGTLQKNAQIFKENSVLGVYEEGNYYVASCDAEFSELRAYLLSKLMQNPYCDYSAEMNGFLSAFYGAAGEDIRRIIDLYTENAGDADGHLGIYVSAVDSLTLTSEQKAEIDALWESAKGKAEGEQLERVRRSELSWRYYRADTDKKGSYAEELYDDLREFGINVLSEGNVFEGSETGAADTFVKRCGPTVWKQNYDGFAVICTYVMPYITMALYGLALVLMLVAFVMAIKKKIWYAVLLFPLMCGFIEIFAWHKRAYIAWKDIDEYVFTMLFSALLFAYMGFIAARLENKSKSKTALWAALSGVVITVVYVAATIVINVAIYNSQGNQAAIGFAYMLASIGILIVSIKIFRSIIKK